MATKKPAAKAAPAPTMGGYVRSAEDIKRDNDYQAEDDLRTLHRAHQIRKDPQRHGRAKAKAKEQMAGLQATLAAK